MFCLAWPQMEVKRAEGMLGLSVGAGQTEPGRHIPGSDDGQMTRACPIICGD